MYIKCMGIMSVLLLTSCASQIALQGIPQLTDGTEARWQYRCEEGNIVVEYANRGGAYSATLDAGSGLRVLPVLAQAEGVRATLAPLAWVSSDGKWFDLYDGEAALLTRCHAVERVKKGSMEIDLGRILHNK